MSEITAAAVMKLRKMSGQGMMDCKNALKETNGDVEKAMEILRKKGLATMAKRAARDTSEGRVVVKSKDNATVMVSLCCETDFVAKNDDFVATADKLADIAFAAAEMSAEALGAVDCDGKPFSEVITELVSKTGEKTEIGDCAKFSAGDNGFVATYTHFDDKSGAMVEIECDSASTASNEDLKRVASEICMHITAVKPVSLDKDSFDPEIIEKEKAIAAEQVKDKPANIIEKIIEGKINKFLSDNCLVNQKFVKNEDLTVEQALSAAAKAAGGEAKIKRFTRVEIS